MTRTPADSLWLAKTRALYSMLKRPRNGPLRLSLPEFRLYLDKHPDKILDRVWRCAYCRALLPTEQVSIDHKLPVSLRGPNAPGNWAVCCQQCNRRKRELGEVQYVALCGLVRMWPKEMQTGFWQRLGEAPAHRNWSRPARERVRVVRRRVA